MIHANQVLSLFREGLDTFDIARRFSISEAQAVNLLHEARRMGFHLGQTSETSKDRGRRRGVIAASAVNRKAPVTLASVSFLRDGT